MIVMGICLLMYSKSALTQMMPIFSGKFRQRVGDSGEVWYDLLIVST